MNERDKQTLQERYQTRLDTHGAVPSALGEPKERQNFYFHFLLDTPAFGDCQSLLDVGCGYGDLAAFLRQSGWSGRYTGIDIVPGLVAAGREKFPGLDLRHLDIELDVLDESFDWVTCIGALSGDTAEVPYLVHLRSMLEAMWAKCRRGMSFNLLSPFVDYRSPVHAHPEIGEVLGIVKGLSRRFVVRNDYMPFEYAVYVIRDDAIDRDISVFSEHRPTFDRLCASSGQ